MLAWAGRHVKYFIGAIPSYQHSLDFHKNSNRKAGVEDSKFFDAGAG